MGIAMDFKNTGKNIGQVGERQQRRKLKELKTKVERALWFTETYGLTLDSASFCEQNGESHVFAFSEKEKHNGFKDLPEVDQEKIKLTGCSKGKDNALNIRNKMVYLLFFVISLPILGLYL